MKEILVSLFVLVLFIQGGFALYGHIFHPQNFLRLERLTKRYGTVFGRLIHITSHIILPWVLALLIVNKVLLN